MKHLFYLCVITLTLFSTTRCKTIYLSELTPETKYGTKRLPPLVPIFDVQSFDNVFPDVSHTESSGYATGHNLRGADMAFGHGSSMTTHSKNPSINDLSVIFERDVRNNICESSGEYSGYITCHVITGANWSPLGLWWAGYFLAGIPYIFGMPIQSSKTHLMIKIDIYDRNQNLIGSYESDYVQQKKYSALYWGYSGANGRRKTAIDAFKICMDDVKQQIASDHNKLYLSLR